MNPLNAARRIFLRQASALSLAGTAAPFALNLASIGAASASTAADYKALVCVFLYGANDAHNTVVPYDATSYSTYAGVRGALAWTAVRSRAARADRTTSGRQAGRVAHGAGATGRAVRFRPVRSGRERRTAGRADRSHQFQREVGAAAAKAVFTQRPAIGVAGVSSRRCQVRLGRPHRRSAREPEREPTLHLQFADRQRSLSQRADGAAVPDRSGSGLDRLQPR